MGLVRWYTNDTIHVTVALNHNGIIYAMQGLFPKMGGSAFSAYCESRFLPYFLNMREARGNTNGPRRLKHAINRALAPNVSYRSYVSTTRLVARHLTDVPQERRTVQCQRCRPLGAFLNLHT